MARGIQASASQTTVMAFFEALGQGNFAKLPDLASEEISYTIYGDTPPESNSAPWAGTHRGLGELQNAFEAIHAALEIHAFELDSILAEAETVAVFGSYDATVRETGKRFKTPFAQRARLRAGLVAECIMLEDSETVVRSLLS